MTTPLGRAHVGTTRLRRAHLNKEIEMLSSGRPLWQTAGTAALAFVIGCQPAVAVDASRTMLHKASIDVLNIAGFVQDDGAAEHMVYAAKLRILSQRIPAAACFEHFGIEKEASAELLRSATLLFDRILDGLEHGDAELGLMKAETDRMILADIAKTHKVWDPLHGLIEKIASGNSTDDDILLLAGKGAALVDVTGHMSSVIMAEYSDPTVLLQEDALLLEIAGRMPMMAQRLSKDMCMIAGDLNADKHRDELVKTRTLFDNTADALRNGMPAMGLKATDNPDILVALDEMMVDWAAISPTFDSLAAGNPITKEKETVMFHAMNALTDQLDQIEVMYSQASKMDL